MLRSLVFSLGLIAASCTSPVDVKESNDPSVPFVSGEGFGFKNEQTKILLKFGASRAEVEIWLAGESDLVVAFNDECGAGPMEFLTSDNGLMLNFQNDKFVGWFLDGETPVKTEKGLGTGDLLSEFSKVYKAEQVTESTLGKEYFSSVDAIGAFGGDTAAPTLIEALYAGTNCFFR